MPKDDAALKAQGEEIEAILQDGKKKELNFVLMKSKGGVVLKAGPSVKGFPKLRAEAKAEGGMPAFSVCGMLTVSGRTMNMAQVEEEPVEPSVMRKLAGQAKKHFKAIGIRPAKMIMTLPNGEVIDSDSVSEEEEDEEGGGDATVAQAPQPAPSAPPGPAPAKAGAPGGAGPDPDAEAKSRLTERLKALVPQVKDAVGKAVPGADKLGAALKAAGGEIAGGGLEKAKKLLDAVEQGLKSAPPPAASAVDQSALKDQLLKDFNGLSGDLRKVVEQGAKAVASKAQQFAQMFQTELNGDLKKASAILAALKRFVEAEAEKVAAPGTAPKGVQPKGSGDTPKEGLFDDIVSGVSDAVGSVGGVISDVTETVVNTVGDTVSTVVDTVTETVSSVVETVTEVGTKVVETVQDVVNDLTGTPEEKSARGLADALGLSREEREKLIEQMKTDPKAAETLARGRMKDAGVPDDRQAELLAMAMHDPKAFVASLGSLAQMEKDGAVDISPDAMQKSLEALEKARQENDAKQKAAAETLAKLQTQMKAYGEAGKAVTDARGKADLAAKAIEELKARIGDPSKLTPEQKLKFAEESRKLINDNEAAKAELAKAIEAEKQASMDYAAASDKNTKAQEAADETREKLGEAQAVQDAKDGKKALIDAMSFGPLSPSGKLSDEDKAKFAGAYGKNARVADGMLAMAGTAKNPKALADSAGMLANAASGGFAAPDGRKLDLPKDQLDQMALNAARMGDEAGGDYFKNFATYLKSGKQLDPDPTGGMDGPLSDPAAEEKRKNKVALARTQSLSGAAVKPDGTVDFNSDAAKGQMDHMMFHPGSLKTFTPQMNMKMAETKALFDNPATKDKANKTIADTKLPGPTAPGRNAAMTLVAGTTGKDKAAVTDNDARASVLGAMMTPLSQGPVGSCFSTAPVHAIRELDPLRAMGEYSKIATTGQFKDKGGNIYPANTRLPEGENPLMRSWEYSVATAAAEKQGSVERLGLREGMFGTQAPGKNFNAVEGIVGNAAWNDSADPSTGDLVPGVKSKLEKAMASQLKFEYNAGPQVGGPSGGGDGHSTDGAYEILYKGKALTSEADFLAAMKEIALAATGETETSTKGAAIVALVTSADFKTTILNGNSAGDYTPWKLSGGGFESQTAMVLDGGNLDNHDVLAANSGTPPKSQTDRTTEVLTNVLTAHKDMTKDLAPLGTTGTRANHAFNTMPNHPSLDKIKDPGSAGKIQKELVEPGQKIAGTKLPAAQAAKLFEEQVKALMEGQTDNMRLLLVAAMKNKPTSDMTPAEIQAKVAQEASAYRDAEAQLRADAYVASDEPTADNTRKAEILQFYKDQVEGGIKASAAIGLANAIPVPEVVVADSNWGGPEGQIYFVAAPDPVSGDLKMWKKDMPGGKLTPLGKNWEDAKWDTVK
jgi:hypothetical protein